MSLWLKLWLSKHPGSNKINNPQAPSRNAFTMNQLCV